MRSTRRASPCRGGCTWPPLRVHAARVKDTYQDLFKCVAPLTGASSSTRACRAAPPENKSTPAPGVRAPVCCCHLSACPMSVSRREGGAAESCDLSAAASCRRRASRPPDCGQASGALKCGAERRAARRAARAGASTRSEASAGAPRASDRAASSSRSSSSSCSFERTQCRQKPVK